MSGGLVTAAYIVAAILFIFSLAGLSKHETSRQGNNFGIAGMAIALIATIFGPDTGNVGWILLAMVIGGAIGIRLAKKVEMTEMPELVAILHSFVGLAAVLVGFNSYLHHDAGMAPILVNIHLTEVFLGIFIGAVTFTGSVVAFGKLCGKISSKPLMLPNRHKMNLAALVVSFLLLIVFVRTDSVGLQVLAALFSGVGIGIALGNEYVLAGLHFDLSSQTLWQGAGALSGMMLIALTLLMPSKKHAITPMPLAKTEQQIMSWWLLAILYGLAGFGYIIVATYLPLMAKDAGSPLLTAHLWTLVGLSIVPGCFGWLWAAKRWGALPCLTANLLVQAICVLLTLASDSPLLLIISSLGFGGTFMGTTSLVMTIARQLSVPGNLNLLGFVTLIYGIGQILGPALTSMLSNGTSALASATLCGAAALFIAALISTVQLFKLQVVTS